MQYPILISIIFITPSNLPLGLIVLESKTVIFPVNTIQPLREYMKVQINHIQYSAHSHPSQIKGNTYNISVFTRGTIISYERGKK